MGPAVTSTFWPAKSRRGSNRPVISSSITSTAGSLPSPTVPQARCPQAGFKICQPRSAKTCRLCCVAALRYIFVFMAGAIMQGQVAASTVDVSASSAMPLAILAIMLAVAGTITSKSASAAVSICTIPQPGPVTNSSCTTAWPVRACSTTGEINSVACLVITQRTSAPFLVSQLAISAAL